MPLKPNPLRLLILASVYGYSVQSIAADTAWQCSTDPITGSWNCQQSGAIEQARTALTMARRAAGKSPLSEDELEQMLQPPVKQAASADLSGPAIAPPATAPEPPTPLAIEASTSTTPGATDDTNVPHPETPQTDSQTTPTSASTKDSPTQNKTPIRSGDSLDPSTPKRTDQVNDFEPAADKQMVEVQRSPRPDEVPTTPAATPVAATPVAATPVAVTVTRSEPDATGIRQAQQVQAQQVEVEPTPRQVPDKTPITVTTETSATSPAQTANGIPVDTQAEDTSAAVGASPDATAPIDFTTPVQDGAWDQIDLLGMDIAATLEKDRKTVATAATSPTTVSQLRKLAEQHPLEIPNTEPTNDPADTAQILDSEIVQGPAHYKDIDPIPFLSPIAQGKEFAVCGTQVDHGLTHNIPAYRPENADSRPTYGEADSIQGRPGEIMTLIGNAVLQRADQTIKSNTIHYNQTLQRADFSEDVQLRESGLAMNSEHGHYIMATNDGEFGASKIYLPDRHTRISANSVSINARDLISTTDTTYTTCNYGDNVWMLDAKEVNLDRTTGTGEAWHAWGKIEGIPVIYTPYISFPIDDRRKTGFLLPAYGTSDDNGTTVDIPFYWNIAPNYDATINARFIENRGLLLENEFRYLHANNNGVWSANLISGDEIFQDDRGYFSVEHNQRLAPNLDVEIEAAHVTDAEFLKDFESTLYQSSLTNLVREAKFTYFPGPYNITATFQDNYTIDRTTAPASRPYRLLPQITGSTSHYDSDTGNQYSLDGEFTYFQNSARLETQRLSLNPRISHSFRSSWGYITPAADLFATHWLLDNPTDAATSSDSLVVPAFSVDSGMYIDKEFTFQDRSLVHSIEPRLFYNYVPHIDQNGHPNFDSSVVDLTYANLFRVNRFSGRDRVGDANQITAAVTNRLSDSENDDLSVHLSLGEIFYFEDRKVGASSTPNSALFGTMGATLPYDIRLTNEFSWDHSNNQTNSIEWRFEWQPSEDMFALYKYNATKNSTRESVFALRVPLTPQLDFLYKRRYNEMTEQTLRRFWGLEYDSCCWAARFGALKDPFQNTTDLEPQTQLYLQIEFKGLVGVGTRVDTLFEEEVKL